MPVALDPKACGVGDIGKTKWGDGACYVSADVGQQLNGVMARRDVGLMNGPGKGAGGGSVAPKAISDIKYRRRNWCNCGESAYKQNPNR
jgi:hypothetical protein